MQRRINIEKKRKLHWKNFFLHVREWNLRHYLVRLDNSHVIVADDEFLSYLSGVKTQSGLRQRQAKGFDGKVADAVKTVIVFCCDGEEQLVRALRARYPKRKIISGSHELLAIGPQRRPVLSPKLSENVTRPQPLIILSTPYADAEFLTVLLQENSDIKIPEYLGRPLISWSALSSGFQPTRLYDRLVRRFASDDKMPMLLQTDVLAAVFKNTSWSMERFVRLCHRYGAKIVTLRTNEPFQQACYGELMDRSMLRSIWQAPLKQPLAVNAKHVGLQNTLKRLDGLAEHQLFLDDIESRLGDCLSLTAGQLIEAPEEHTAKVLEFFGLDVSGDVSGDVVSVNRQERYQRLEAFENKKLLLRRNLHDRLGLNAALV